ncbi:MAG TPA: ABC transporter ATP-binding protein [Burkholderiaceae bacterium]|nr:ABC transporter ATP-binding protein [Burkholderiaceae bacterium]
MRITAEAITVTIGAATLLDDVSMTAQPGKLLGLVGPNGAGKSTLLRVLAGLRDCTRGQVRYDGPTRDGPQPLQLSQKLSYLAQRGPVAWPLTVERLVALGRLPHLQAWGTRDEQGAAAINAALTDTDTQHLRQRIVDTLSGGELARALLARALAVGGAALLADEPVAELDPYHQLQVMEILRARADSGQTVIVVLHEITLAERFCDRLVLLDRGRVAAAGAPADVLTDENLHATYRVSALRGERDGTAYLLPWQRTDHADAETAHKSA